MPLESVTCTSCGAGDVQEVKPDTYFCNHCEGVFKYAKPRGSGGPAVCEIDGCGVLAVGRCRECGTAICWTHDQASGMCGECYQHQQMLEFKERYGSTSNGITRNRVCARCGGTESIGQRKVLTFGIAVPTYEGNAGGRTPYNGEVVGTVELPEQFCRGCIEFVIDSLKKSHSDLVEPSTTVYRDSPIAIRGNQADIVVLAMTAKKPKMIYTPKKMAESSAQQAENDRAINRAIQYRDELASFTSQWKK